MASIYDPAAPTVSSSDVTDSPYGNGLHITGTDGDNAIAGSAFGDLIEGSLGNDLIKE